MTIRTLPEETRQSRRMMDALRELLGMSPLYNCHFGEPLHSWTSDLTDSYEQRYQGQTQQRGSGT